LSLIRDYYLRFRELIHEIGKFGVVGLVATIITFAVQNALYGHVGPTTLVVVANAIATCFAFLGNRYWAFRRRKTANMGRETVLFVFFNLVGTLIQTACVDSNHYLLHNHDRISLNIATVVGMVFATLFRLFCYRKFVFNSIPATQDAAEELSGITHKYLSPEEARIVASDAHLKAEWTNVNASISTIYELLGPPPLKTLSGTEHGR
jgi:putative flippase GtrA